MLPRFMSLGGFDSRSRNLRFWLMAALLFVNGEIGAWTTGAAERISSGSKIGSGIFPECLGFAGRFRSSSLMPLGDFVEDSSSSTCI